MSPANLTLGRSLMAGLGAGSVATFTANVALVLLTAVTGQRFPELSPGVVMGAALVANLVGGLGYYGLSRFTRRPSAWYAVAALALATLSSAAVVMSQRPPGFGWISHPLHYVVAATSIWLLPALVRDPTQVVVRAPAQDLTLKVMERLPPAAPVPPAPAKGVTISVCSPVENGTGV